MEKVAAALYVADLILLISFQVLNRDYTLLPQAVSNYGLGKTARLFKVYMLAGSCAAPLLAWQFLVARDPALPAAVSVYLVLVMAGRVTLALFPNDLHGAPHTTSGLIHHAATLVAFACAYMAVAEATPVLAGEAMGVRFVALTTLKHLISLAFLAVVVAFSPPLRRYFGLAERLFLYATALWFPTASLILPPL